MRFEQYLIALLMASLILFIGFAIFGSNITNYELENANTGKFNGTYDKLEEVFEQQKDLEEDIRGDGVTEENTEDSMFRGAFKAISGLWTSVQIGGEVTNIVAKESNIADESNTGIVSRITGTFLVILALLLLASMVYLVFRFKPK